ncbi:uncharacterized protein LOC123700097, partial [Colias croceus]|uniref:uncharacterized protein LOC123700097 n=1 Tax=Colias crocea TaxID=72248 RepID=UPI001E27C37B
MLNFEEVHLAIAVRKFVHQKDMSEYCRRRVVPSVFLGKHVVEANSQILHFSQLEMPYSCSISVRTEFGNNIILVVQLLSERSLAKSCLVNNNQLLIYELGETFGGYWGVIPDTMIKLQPQNYTKYYTLKTTPETEKTTVTDYEYEYDDQETDSMKPLFSRTTDVKTEEDFIRIDVPLVNITGNLGLDEISSHRRLDTDEFFDLIYDVTPRNGVSYDTSIIPLVQFSIKKQTEDQRRGNYLQPKYELDYSYQGFTPDSSEGIPSVSSETSRSTDESTPLDIFLNNTRLNIKNSIKKNLSTVETTETPLTSVEISSDSIDEVKIFFTSSKTTKHESGSLVNHKSFENVVQAAPDIAVLLNKYNVESLPKEVENMTSPIRKKRYIKALEIENARPRNLTTLKTMTRTTEKVYRYSDMQDLAQLVELEDDEIQGRVALRYLRKYVGSALFNICDYNEPKARQVYLFNSSRIVIAISNFTMDRMTLVVTPASTLMSSVGRCPPAHLECQVAGTRVCIDATNECDGVPNCGAYDIYDEDRLRCGWSLGLQHNVCLAACTFLAVILTILYTIHYWLKRCVPRVSEAFFVYSDA